MKASLEHGQFTAWIAAEFDMTDRTARNYMMAAEAFGAKTEIVSDLSATTIYALAAPSTPEAFREQVVDELRSGAKLTPDEIAGPRSSEPAKINPAVHRSIGTKRMLADASRMVRIICERCNILIIFRLLHEGFAMVQFPEFIQIKAPAGTMAALSRIAEAEGKRVTDIVREAVTDRIAADRSGDPAAKQEAA